MTDKRVRRHLAQAATCADDPDAYGHVKAAMMALDEPAPSQMTDRPDTHQITRAETTLEHWLVEHATAGVPETVLIDSLRTYADRVESLGHVPRSWHPYRSQPAAANPVDGRARHD